MYYNDTPKEDKYPVLWGLLGLICPVAGAVLYFSWRSVRPRISKALLIGACIPSAILILGGIAIFLMGVFGGISSM